MTNELKTFYFALKAFNNDRQHEAMHHHMPIIVDLLKHTYSLLSEEEKELIGLVCDAEVHDIIYTR